MSLPYTELFVGLLVAYMAYSAWARLDSRYLIAGALALLVAAAIVDAGGATGAANTLAVYVFLLLAGGVVLLLVDHIRDRPTAPGGGRPPSDGGSGTSEPPAQTPNERHAEP